MKTIKIIATAFLLFTSCYLKAQEFEGNVVKYRVTAVKKGETDIVSLSNTAQVHTPLNLYIPNAFTPNGDGLNDEFAPVGYGVKQFEMKIFNRWGELIFTTDDIQNKWDGTYLGEKVQPGSYVYDVTAIGFQTNNKLQKTGTISIVKI
jgi:gliding motility-associated-like protein